AGPAGKTVVILGNNLSGATSVTFNGKAAKFRVVSSTEITTTVPKGATSGKIKVVTPSRTLTTNVSFQVS
ncbi:MAG: IPT/TIG domain-containing protein, partial [Deltaproteobacteria bacterium]|nr:IPT/TIG domain-containing protein [Deltaproteobacteria bacterium]